MTKLFHRINQSLRSLEKENRLRVLFPNRGYDFCSNDYLGLSVHPRVKEAAGAYLKREGFGSSSSRFIRGERDIYQPLEKRLATFKESQKALIFSSGYQANIGSLSSLIKINDVVFSDELNHASIIDGLRLSKADIRIFYHLDVDDLWRKFKTAPKDAQKFIVTESLFSMDGDVAPLDKYAELCRHFDAQLIVDEAHAVGIFGNNGGGLVCQYGLSDDVLLSINGLGKAFGCIGAFIAGKNFVVDYVLQHARTLMFTTALPPLCLAAILEALNIIEAGMHLRQKLFLNISMLNELLQCYGLKSNDCPFSPIIPIYIGENKKAKDVSDRLIEKGFDIRCIRPPTVPITTSRLRITASVLHERDVMEKMCRELRALL